MAAMTFQFMAAITFDGKINDCDFGLIDEQDAVES